MESTLDAIAAQNLGTEKGSLCGLRRLLTDGRPLKSLGGLALSYPVSDLFHTFH